MTGFIGMDVEAIRSLSAQLHQASNEVTTTANNLNNALQNANWVGNDATSFRNDWQSHYQNLQTVATALADAGTAAMNNANQQEQAST
jgi:uncharacterized protein YukE